MKEQKIVMVSEGARREAHGTGTPKKKKHKKLQVSQCAYFHKNKHHKCALYGKCVGHPCEKFLDNSKYEISPNGNKILKAVSTDYRKKLKTDITEVVDVLMPVLEQIENKYANVCDGLFDIKVIIEAFRNEFNKRV